MCSLCSPAQKVHYLQSTIRPYITYSFPLAIYSTSDIKRFDTAIVKIAKKAYGLPAATPSNLVLREKDDNGMGISSLMVDYVQLNAAYLTRALNDEGPLGWTTRAMMRQQHTLAAGTPNMHKDKQHRLHAAATQDLHIIRQLSLLQGANMRIVPHSRA